MNLKDGGTSFFATPRELWKFHPNVPKGQFVDVAVLPFGKPQEVKLLVLDVVDAELPKELIDNGRIGVGSEVYTIGLFTNHFGDDRNIPVARFGAISMLPQEPMWTEYGYMEGYLVEARSLGGSSGSPVFVVPDLWMVEEGHHKMMADMKEWYWIGLISGHWTVENPDDAVSDDPESRGTGRINTGMMIVVPASKIKETIDHPDLVAMRAKQIDAKKAEATGRGPSTGKLD
jgi:hypothetical protein